MKVIIGGLSKLGRQFLKDHKEKMLLIDYGQAIEEHIQFIKERGYIYYPLDFKYLNQEELVRLSCFLEELKETVTDILVMSGSNSQQSIYSISLGEWENVFSICLKGPVFVVKQLIPYVQREGNIIVISSMNSVMTHPKRVDYGSAKAALNMWVKNLAQELMEKGIYVNAILPGYIYEDDSYNRALFYTKDNGKMVGDYFIRYKEVVNFIEYLLEKNSGAMNGQLFVMDKGFSL